MEPFATKASRWRCLASSLLSRCWFVMPSLAFPSSAPAKYMGYVVTETRGMVAGCIDNADRVELAAVA